MHAKRHTITTAYFLKFTRHTYSFKKCFPPTHEHFMPGHIKQLENTCVTNTLPETELTDVAVFKVTG